MSCLKLVRVSDTASKADILENIRLPTILGRGALLKCREKKVSRSHATLDWDNHERILIESTHRMPTYIRTSSGKKTLHLGESAVLKDGDQFGLLADSFWYKVVLNIPEDNDKHIKEITEKNENICEDVKAVKVESTVIIENKSVLSSHLIIEHKNNTCTDNFEQKFDNNEYISAKEEKVDTGVFENVNISQVAAENEKNCLPENSKIQPTLNNGRQRQLPKWLTSAKSSMQVDADVDFGKKNLELKKNKIHGQKMKKVAAPKMPEDKIKIVKKPTSTVTKNSSKLSKNKQYHSISQEIQDESPTVNNQKYINPNVEVSCCIKAKDSPSVTDVIDEKGNFNKGEKNDYMDNGDKNKELNESLPSVSNVDTFLNQKQNGESSCSSSNKYDSANHEDDKVKGVVSVDVDDEKPRQSCLFGENCFRRNRQHKKDYAHPNDKDYMPPKDINSDGLSDDERPECEHGVDCYRKNPQHKKDFKHTRFPQPRRRAKIAKRKREEDDDSENEYDEDDPFLNDDSSDDYAPTDSDADSPFDDDGVEEEDTKRMLKEAKKFSKKKRS